MGLPQRPTHDRRAAGGERGRPGQALPRLRRAAARARRDERAGAADVLRHERPHALPERAPDAHARCSSGACCRSSTRTTRPPPTRSPSATTTSWPRRWRCSSAADELILLTDIDGLYTADPRLHPDARIVSEVERLRGARRARDRPHHLAARLGRDALEGRRRRDGDGGGDRDGDLQRAARRRRSRRCSRASREGTRFPPREARYCSFKLWLKYAKPTRGTLVIDAGAARARARGQREPAARSASSRCSASSTRATRSRSPSAPATAASGARALGEGDLQLLGRGAAR